MSRIVFFVSSMQGGGAERVASLLCNRWVQRGHAVLLVPTFSSRGDCNYKLDSQVRLVYLADRVGRTRRTPWSLVRRLWAMRAMVREFRADAVLSFLTNVNVATILATRGLGMPVVVAERSYPPAMELGLLWSWLRRLTYPWASSVVMQTKSGLAWLTHASPRSLGAVIPNPCEFPLPPGEPRLDPETVLSAGRRVLLAVGRLAEEKGLGRLIQAFEILASRFPAWDLVIVGEGAELAVLKVQCEAAGLAARVHLPGRAGNIGDWYARADLYVMSSRFEGFPNTLMEAMAYGLPAVSFDCDTGPAELIEDGVSGYLVPPAAGAPGLAERLAVLMGNDDRRRNMGEQASKIRQRYSMEQVDAEWDWLFKRLTCDALKRRSSRLIV